MLQELRQITFGITVMAVLASPFSLGWFVYRKYISTDQTKSKPSTKSLAIYLATLVALVLLTYFLSFLHRLQPKPISSEAKTSLGQLYQDQKIFFKEHDFYAGGPRAFELLYSWEPARKNRYAYFCGDDFIPNKKGDPIPRSARPAVVGSSTTGFTCAAVGNVDNDPNLDVWTIDDAKQVMNVNNDI